MYIALLKSDSKYYIFTDRSGNVIAREHSHEILGMFERAYNDAHYRSYEGSMSACISYISCQPSVIQVKDVDEIRSIAGDEMHLYQLSIGFGINCKTEVAEKYFEKGLNPKLIS